MTLAYSYVMGTCRWQWMLFWSPFLTSGKRFVEIKSCHRIELTTWLFYQISLKPAPVPLSNPFGWPPACQIGAIHWINAVGGANGTPWWWCLWGVLCWCLTEFLYYSYWSKPTGQVFLVPAWTRIVVKLLINVILLLLVFSEIRSPAVKMSAATASIVDSGHP